jgi:hypothetical protein
LCTGNSEVIRRTENGLSETQAKGVETVSFRHNQNPNMSPL